MPNAASTSRITGTCGPSVVGHLLAALRGDPVRLVRRQQLDPPGRPPVVVERADQPVRARGCGSGGEHVEEAADGVDRLPSAAGRPTRGRRSRPGSRGWGRRSAGSGVGLPRPTAWHNPPTRWGTTAPAPAARCGRRRGRLPTRRAGRVTSAPARWPGNLRRAGRRSARGHAGTGATGSHRGPGRCCPGTSSGPGRRPVASRTTCWRPRRTRWCCTVGGASTTMRCGAVPGPQLVEEAR